MDSEDIRSQLSPTLQKLMDDILSHSDGRPLVFVDELEYEIITGKSPELTEDEACFTGSEKRFFICLKSLAPMTPEKELPVSHEMGHLWLTLHSFPRENRNISDEQQKRYDSLFGPLLEVMEHAIFYPWLKNNYGIDLYRVGNQRLVDFLKNKFPNRKNESQGDQVSLILNYIKFKVESNSSYWQERFSRAYSKNKFIDLKLVGERVLPIIQELASKPPDPQYFIKKYREVLETMNIEQELWPDFCSLVKKY